MEVMKVMEVMEVNHLRCSVFGVEARRIRAFLSEVVAIESNLRYLCFSASLR